MYGGKTKLKKWKPKVIHLAPLKKWMQKIHYLCSIHRVRRVNLKVSYILPEVTWSIPDTPSLTYSNTNPVRFIFVPPTSVGLQDIATLYTAPYHREPRL